MRERVVRERNGKIFPYHIMYVKRKKEENGRFPVCNVIYLYPNVIFFYSLPIAHLSDMNLPYCS